MMLVMRHMKLVGVICILLAAPYVAAVAAEERPAWCKPGWECVPTDEIAKDTMQHIALHTEIIRLKAKSRHLGFTLGCGVGVAAIVTSEWDGITSPGGFCGAMYGWRF